MRWRRTDAISAIQGSLSRFNFCLSHLLLSGEAPETTNFNLLSLKPDPHGWMGGGDWLKRQVANHIFEVGQFSDFSNKKKIRNSLTNRDF